MTRHPGTPSAASSRLRAAASRFQVASTRSALGQIASTILPLLLLLGVMHAGAAFGQWWLVPLLAIPAAGLTVRTFIIQHDCGHGSFLSSRPLNDALGRFCSLFTFTPYLHWRRQHAQHHGCWNDLDRREGRGSDIYSTCLTVAEYRALTPRRRLWHRVISHPVVALLIVPPFIFLALYRFPFDTPKDWQRERRSVHCTNLALAAVYGGIGLLLGFGPVAMTVLAVMVPTSVVGVWLFSLQHRFEDAYWARHENWDATAAAMEGSSFLRLPRPLQWWTGSIGFHHVHHLAPRVPNYQLEACHHALPECAAAPVLSLKEGLSAFRHGLWDEETARMVRFPALKIWPDRRAGHAEITSLAAHAAALGSRCKTAFHPENAA